MQFEDENKDQPFSEWTTKQLKNVRGGAVAVIGILGTVSSLVVVLGIRKLPPLAHTPILYAIQAVIIFIIAAIIAFWSKHKLPTLPSWHESHGEVLRGAAAVKQFWRWWSRLWFVWAVLYVFLTVWGAYSYRQTKRAEEGMRAAIQLEADRKIKEDDKIITEALKANETGKREEVKRLINEARISEEADKKTEEEKRIEDGRRVALVLFGLHLVNNAATLILLMLFHVLARPSVRETTGMTPAREQSSESAPDSPPAAGEVRIGFGTSELDNTEAKFTFWIAFLVVTFSAAELALVLSSGDPATLSQVFGVGYGITAATATALVVGRLDSTLLGVPTAALIVLFVYAAIQPTFELLLEPNKPNTKTIAAAVIAVVALVSKIVLFAVTRWLLKTNRLLYYMVRAYRNFEKADEDRKEFFASIRPPADSAAPDSR
jgi:hypothetical protein